MPISRFRTIDLFAGIGGVRRGFENADFTTVYSADIDPYCKKTYDLNFKDVPLSLQDISAVDPFSLPKFDVLLAGFPCQPFSVAGDKRGFKDEGRGDLFFDIVRILESKKPAAIFLENVKNLSKHDHGKTFVVIKEHLERCGYKIKFAVLNSSEYGNVPQSRERIYIAGFRNQDACDRFEFPARTQLIKTVLNVLDENVPSKYYYRKGWLYDRIKDAGMQKGYVYQWRRVYLRENKSGLCFTLTANMGMGGHNVPLVKDRRGMRRLTPRECARLQGFPESFKFPLDVVDSRLYKQIGNSVTATVVERIAQNMKAAMEAKTNHNYGRRLFEKKAERDNVANPLAEYVA